MDSTLCILRNAWLLITPLLQAQTNKYVAPEKEWQNDLAKPSRTEYTGEGANEFLNALEAVAGLIPLPGVAAAVKIAKNIIQACDVSKYLIVTLLTESNNHHRTLTPPWNVQKN